MKLAVVNDAFVLLPSTVDEATRLAGLVGQHVTVAQEQAMSNFAMNPAYEHMTQAGRSGQNAAAGIQIIGSAAQSAATSA